MKDRERVHSELCMLYSKRDVYAHEWARGELASQSLLDDIWGKIYALRWVLDKNIQWGVADEPLEKGEPGTFELWPLRCYCYPGCEMPSPLPAGLTLDTLKEVAYTTEAGQQRYYKAEEVMALVGRLQERLARCEGALTAAYAKVEGEETDA